MKRWAWLAVLLLILPSPAWGHARSTSFSYWEAEDARLNGRLVFPWVEVQQAFPQWRGRTAEQVLGIDEDAQALLRFFAGKISFGEAGCKAVWTGPFIHDANLRFQVEAPCAGPVAELQFDLTFDVAPSHVHLVRYEAPGRVISGVVTSGARRWSVTPDAKSAAASFGDFVASGFAHILAGPDHLLFLVALLLMAASLGGLAWLATGFTLAHSLSLAIAVYGLTAPHGPTVEALIGFTVAFSGLEVFLLLEPSHRARAWMRAGFAVFAAASVAASALGVFALQTGALLGVALFCACFLFLADQRLRWRWLLVFLFGFVHGFGFAGPLLEMQLDRAQTAQALMGFNLGVEAGQLAFLLVVWPVVRIASRGGRRVPVAAALAAIVVAAGLQWFLLRAIG